MRRNLRVRGGMWAVVLASGVVGIAGCGSTSSSSSSAASSAASQSTSSSVSSASGSGDPAGVTSAKALVTQYSATQAPLSIPPLPKGPPKNLAFTYVGCTVPGCSQNDVTAAAKALGWKLSFVPYDVDSTMSFASAFNQALQNNPKVFGYVGALPNALVTKQLAEFKSRGTPTVTIASTDGLPPGISGCYFCAPQFSLDGKLMADIVAADAGSAQTIGYVTESTLQKSAFAPVYSGFTSEINRTLPGSKVDLIDTSLSAPAEQNGSTVVSYLSSHPNVKYLVVAVAALTAGVPQAIAQAGMSNHVKIVTRLLQPPNLAQVKSGQIFAGVVSEDETATWRQIDALARLSEGLKVYDPEPVGWHMIIDKQNAGSITSLEPAGFPSAFLKAWHVQ